VSNKYRTEAPIRLTGAIVTGIAAAGIALVPAHSTAPLSRAMVAAFLVIAPTLAIARLLPSMHTAVALIVGVAGAIAINTLVAQAMLSAELWSRPAGVITVGIAAIAFWLIPIPGRAKWRHGNAGRRA
jgi:hypothetical protein